MSTFTLAISCLTTSNLPWSMDLTFQVPMQYCSLQHQTLFSPPDKSTNGHLFCFGSASSFLLELPSLSGNLLGPYWPGEFIFQCNIFLTFHTVCWVLKVRLLTGLPFLSSLDHVFSEFSTTTHPSRVALHGLAYSFIGLDKVLCQDGGVEGRALIFSCECLGVSGRGVSWQRLAVRSGTLTTRILGAVAC